MAVLGLNLVIPLEFCFNCSTVLIFVSYSASHLTPLCIQDSDYVEENKMYNTKSNIAYIIKMYSGLVCFAVNNTQRLQATNTTLLQQELSWDLYLPKKPQKRCIEFCLTDNVLRSGVSSSLQISQ